MGKLMSALCNLVAHLLLRLGESDTFEAYTLTTFEGVLVNQIVSKLFCEVAIAEA